MFNQRMTACTYIHAWLVLIAQLCVYLWTIVWVFAVDVADVYGEGVVSGMCFEMVVSCGASCRGQQSLT